MDKKRIIEFLEENNIDEIEEVQYKDNILVFRLFYDFDKDELVSAKAYANDECESELESDSWYEEYLLPYLDDIAIDNVGEIIQELIDDNEIEAQYISYPVEKEAFDYAEFIVVFYKGIDINIESILDELEL